MVISIINLDTLRKLLDEKNIGQCTDEECPFHGKTQDEGDGLMGLDDIDELDASRIFEFAKTMTAEAQNALVQREFRVAQEAREQADLWLRVYDVANSREAKARWDQVPYPQNPFGVPAEEPAISGTDPEPVS